MPKSLGLNPTVNLQFILWVKSQQTAGQCFHKLHVLYSCQFLHLVEFFKSAEENDCRLKGSYQILLLTPFLWTGNCLPLRIFHEECVLQITFMLAMVLTEKKNAIWEM